MINVDVLIIGGGISGHMMAKRLSILHPNLQVTIMDKGDGAIHPFHLHRPISEIPELVNLKPHRLITNIWDGQTMKHFPTVLDIGAYSRKIFGGKLQTHNLNSQPEITIFPISKHKLQTAFSTAVPVINDTVDDIDSVNKIAYGRTSIICYKYLISTIPLPALLIMLEINHNIPFCSFPFFATKATVPSTNMYWMIYNTDPSCNITRATLLDDEIFLELRDIGLKYRTELSALELWKEKENEFISQLFPDMEIKFSPFTRVFGRFNPLSQLLRKPLLHWLTQELDVFCLGRYGAWTFKVANDVWDDTKQICSWINDKEQGKKFRGGE